MPGVELPSGLIWLQASAANSKAFVEVYLLFCRFIHLWIVRGDGVGRNVSCCECNKVQDLIIHIYMYMCMCVLICVYIKMHMFSGH